MITPRAFHLIIKHLNEIDQRVSLKMLSKRPWGEVSLTSFLCDLLDKDTQPDEKIDYGILQLNQDLQAESTLTGIELSIESNEFSSMYESFVSQSDLGIKIIYTNNFEPELSWTRPFLLQAKKLMAKKLDPVFYDESSRFESKNKKQEERIAILKTVIGDSIKYLYFCPRPEKTLPHVEQQLAYLRTKRLNEEIFDFTFGLELYNELKNGQPTIGAGVFITETGTDVQNLGMVHQSIFEGITPFSWFIPMLFLDNMQKYGLYPNDAKKDEITEKIISGDISIIQTIKDKINPGRSNLPDDFTIFPSHTLTIKYAIGKDFNSDNNSIGNG